MPELVTAIVPTYNRAALLVRALSSIAAQEYSPIEVVIVDDGSTDNTQEIIPAQKQLLVARGIELTYHRQTNGGPAMARNTGIAKARGSLITFLDSDDLWRPTFASTLAGLLTKYPTAGVAFCGIQGIDIDDKVFAERPLEVPSDQPAGLLPRPFDFLINRMALQTSGVMVRREALDRVGVFDLTMPVGEDWDLWYRLSQAFDFGYTVEGLACNRHHTNNIPKWDARALALGLALNLKYLPIATLPKSRDTLRHRVQWHMLLLQEEVLRLGKSANGYATLLDHEEAPRSTRYRLGSWMRRRPAWAGRAYAAAIRAIGKTRGLFKRSGSHA